MGNSDFAFNVTGEDFHELVLQRSHEVPVMVDFWADWCAPCRMLLPILAKLVEEYAGQFVLAKINTDEQQTLASQYGVRSLPTVKIFKNGEPVDEFMGAQPESAIRAILDRHIERASDRMVAQAQAALEQGHGEKALQLLQAANDADPANPRVKIALARVLTHLGETERAEIVLDDLTGEARDSDEVKGLKAQLSFARIAAEQPDVSKLHQTLEANPDDLQARYRLSAHEILRGNFESAMDQLLAIMERDREFGEDAGRKGLLAVFEMLGGGGDLVNRYRSRMFNILH